MRRTYHRSSLGGRALAKARLWRVPQHVAVMPGGRILSDLAVSAADPRKASALLLYKEYK
jgi:hypothetical protein